MFNKRNFTYRQHFKCFLAPTYDVKRYNLANNFILDIKKLRNLKDQR